MANGLFPLPIDVDRLEGLAKSNRDVVLGASCSQSSSSTSVMSSFVTSGVDLDGPASSGLDADSKGWKELL